MGVKEYVIILHLADSFIDGMPSTHIGPAEITLHHIHVFALLQYRIVERKVRITRIIRFNILQLLVQRIARMLNLQVAQHLRENLLKSQNQVLGIGDEDARIPIELTTLHEHLGKIALRFLRKRLHLKHLRLAAQVAQLDVTVSWLRSCRLDTHRQ